MADAGDGLDDPSELPGVYTAPGGGQPDFSDSQLVQAAFGRPTDDGSADEARDVRMAACRKAPTVWTEATKSC